MAKYLVDKSAIERMRHPAVDARLSPIIEAGEAATCGLIDLEILYSARNATIYEEIWARRALAYQRVPISESTIRRAAEVQRKLAKSGKHRVAIPDLIIAAVAEEASLIVLQGLSGTEVSRPLAMRFSMS